MQDRAGGGDLGAQDLAGVGAGPAHPAQGEVGGVEDALGAQLDEAEAPADGVLRQPQRVALLAPQRPAVAGLAAAGARLPPDGVAGGAHHGRGSEGVEAAVTGGVEAALPAGDGCGTGSQLPAPQHPARGLNPDQLPLLRGRDRAGGGGHGRARRPGPQVQRPARLSTPGVDGVEEAVGPRAPELPARQDRRRGEDGAEPARPQGPEIAVEGAHRAAAGGEDGPGSGGEKTDPLHRPRGEAPPGAGIDGQQAAGGGHEELSAADEGVGVGPQAGAQAPALPPGGGVEGVEHPVAGVDQDHPLMRGEPAGAPAPQAEGPQPLPRLKAQGPGEAPAVGEDQAPVRGGEGRAHGSAGTRPPQAQPALAAQGGDSPVGSGEEHPVPGLHDGGRRRLPGEALPLEDVGKGAGGTRGGQGRQPQQDRGLGVLAADQNRAGGSSP